MSNHLSPAQSLPLDIIHSILNWIVLEKRSPLHGNSRQVSHLKEFLTVSSSWRQAALEILWRHLSLTIDVTTNKVRLNCPRWIREQKLPHNVSDLTKSIVVNIPINGIASGAALKLLVDYIGDTKCFPLANNLTVYVSYYPHRRADPKDITISNVLEFAKLLRSVAPVATMVDVSCEQEFARNWTSDDCLDDFLDEETLMIFANELHANTSRAKLSLHCIDVGNLPTIDNIPLLSSLYLCSLESPLVQSSLVHKSANTLQYLQIEIRDVNLLMCDPNGDAVIYPNLQYLYLRWCVCIKPYASAISSDTIPFPMLRGVIMRSLYPFYDDELFRGNTATLEYLDCRFGCGDIAMLNQSQAFNSKRKALKHVLVRMANDNADFSPIPVSDVNKFLNNLASGTNRLSVMTSIIARACIEAAQCGQGFKNLRIFQLRSDDLTVYEVLNILKVLPILEVINCGVSGLGPKLENISTEDLPDHIATTYGNGGKNLQKCIIRTNYKKQDAAFTIDCILLLALVCPNLGQVKLISRFIEDYRTKFTDAINSRPYSKYSQQLNKIPDIVRG